MTLEPDAAPPLRWWNRFHVRLTTINAGVVLIVLGAMAVVYYELSYQAELEGLQGRLRATAVTVARHVDPDALAEVPRGARAHPFITELSQRFRDLVAADPDIDTIYVMRATDDPDTLQFVVDYAVRDQATPGDDYDASAVPLLRRGLREVTVESRLWRDAWGLSLSGYAPVMLNGQPYALVGVDVMATSLDQISTRVLTTTLIFYSAALALLLLLAVALSRSIRRPLTAINTAATRIVEGDFSGRIRLDRKDEFGLVGRRFDEIAESLQERDFIRDTFGKFVSQDVARRVLSDRSAQLLGGEERDATVLFSDIEGYSSMNERVAPATMVEVLNTYLTAMTEVIEAHQGVVIEFLGDAILCVFNTPNDVDGHAEAAVRCALKMRRRLAELNRSWKTTAFAEAWRESGFNALQVRLGIHSGVLVAGNIGSPTRMKYGVLGDVVNIAARLEQLNKRIGTTLLLSQATWDRLPPTLREIATPRGPQRLRGREASVTVYAM